MSVENEGSLLPGLVGLNPLVDDWCSLTWAWKQSEFQSEEETSGRQKKKAHGWDSVGMPDGDLRDQALIDWIEIAYSGNFKNVTYVVH